MSPLGYPPQKIPEVMVQLCFLQRKYPLLRIFSVHTIPVVPHKAVAEVSRIGNV